MSTAPGCITNLQILQNLNLIALVQLSDLGEVSTCAGTDIQSIGSIDTTGNTQTSGRCIQLHVTHADPAAVGTTPNLRLCSDGLIDGNVSTGSVIANMCIGGACAGTDTQRGAVVDHTGSGDDIVTTGADAASGGTGGAGGTGAAGGEVHIFHGAGIDFSQLDIVQADPALFGQTPSGSADLLAQRDLDFVVTVVYANLCVLGASTCTNIDIVASVNGTDCGDLLCIFTVGDLAGLVVSVLQCDPTLLGLTPGVVTALLDSGQNQLLTLLVSTLLCIVGTGANAVVDIVGGNSNGKRFDCRTCGLVNRSRCQTCSDVDPTSGDLAPLLTVGIHILSGNAQLGITLDGILLGAVGSIIDIVVCARRHIAGDGQCSTLDGVVRIQRTLTLLPMCIQGSNACSAGTQRGNPVAAFSLGIPTHETVAVLGNSSLQCCVLGGIIALNGYSGGSTGHVAIVNNILVVCRRSIGVSTGQIQVCLTQTALNQTANNITAGLTKLSHSKDQIIAGLTVDNSAAQGAGGVRHPAGAQIVCKGNQRIKLSLRQLQIVRIDKGVDRSLESFEILCQQLGSFRFGDTVGIVICQCIAGNASAIANSPLTVVRVRPLAEAFEVFDHVDAHGAGRHVGCSRNADNSAADQTKDNN